jgi:hypothetical protein
LRESRVFRRDADIRRQQQFDSDGQAFSLHGRHQRLCPHALAV